MAKNIVLLIVALLMTGCSHLVVNFPTPVVETPELSGKEKTAFGVALGMQSSVEHEASADASARPPNLSNPDASGGLWTHAGVYSDLFRRLRFSGNLDPFNSGYFFGTQVQILGEGRKTAQAGNFALSIFAHAGTSSKGRSGDQAGTFGPGGNPWTAKSRADWHSFGFSLGYRVANSIMFYLGGAKQLSLVRSEIDHSQGVAPNGQYYSNDRGEGEKGSVGFAWGSGRGQLHIAYEYSDIRFKKAHAAYIASLLLGIQVDL